MSSQLANVFESIGTPGLYAWLFDRLDLCLPFRALLDVESGVRRMDTAPLATYQRLVTFGRLIRSALPGHERKPLQFQSVKFSLWVRPETTVGGDLMLEELEDWILRILVWKNRALLEDQDCPEGELGMVVMDAQHVPGSETEPEFDEKSQAWTKAFRIRFLVNIATCATPAAWCGPCAEMEAALLAAGSAGGGVGSGGAETEAELETAFTQISPGQEGSAGSFDVYVANHDINTNFLEANPNVPSDAVVLFYGTPALVLDFSSAMFAAIKAATIEKDFWHLGGIMDEAHRIELSPNLWITKPSPSLGIRIATAMLSVLNPYFDGIFSDETTRDIQDHYWTKMKTAGGADVVTDLDRPYWEAQWDSMLEAYIDTLKGAWGSTKAFVANAKLDTHPKWDGKTTEAGHIIVAGEAAARASFEQQAAYWEASPNKYGTRRLMIAWDYPSLQTAGEIIAGTIG